MQDLRPGHDAEEHEKYDTGELTNPGYLDPLWTDPRGHMAVAGGLIWFGLGIGIMYKMVKFEI